MPGPTTLEAPVGSPAPAVTDRFHCSGSEFNCHFTAGATLEKPLPALPFRPSVKLGRSTRISRHDATPSLSLLLLPSNVFSDPRPVVLIPFSLWRLPSGTTRLEFVTSGRSVAIADSDVGHSPACAALGAPVVARKAKRAAARTRNLHLMSACRRASAERYRRSMRVAALFRTRRASGLRRWRPVHGRRCGRG